MLNEGQPVLQGARLRKELPMRDQSPISPQKIPRGLVDPLDELRVVIPLGTTWTQGCTQGFLHWQIICLAEQETKVLQGDRREKGTPKTASAREKFSPINSRSCLNMTG